MGQDGYISASGASAQMRDLDVVSNNLANAGTPGFKRSQSIFRAVLEGALRDGAGNRAPGATGSAFVSTDGVGTDFARGSSERTGSPLHAVIDGAGFFEVETQAGPRYTRAGNFIVNREGLLAAPSGFPILGQGGPINVPDGDARIEADGSLTDSLGNVLGVLKVVDFANLQDLSRDGQGLFRLEEGAETRDVETARFIPGSVEGSNVEPSRELANMVILQRAFETNMRAMQVDDETTQRLIEGIR